MPLDDAAAGFLPTAGIGASMAMESAAALDDELARTDSRFVPQALQLYEKRRKHRVGRNGAWHRFRGWWGKTGRFAPVAYRFGHFRRRSAAKAVHELPGGHSVKRKPTGPTMRAECLLSALWCAQAAHPVPSK